MFKSMKNFVFAATLIASPVLAETAVDAWRTDPRAPVFAVDVDLSDFKWEARPLIVFADSPDNAAFQKQMELIQAEMANVEERDILLVIDTDPAAQSDLRRALRPKGFAIILVGKDGGVKMRETSPTDIMEFSAVIDRMPMRRLEIEQE